MKLSKNSMEKTKRFRLVFVCNSSEMGKRNFNKAAFEPVRNTSPCVRNF